MLNKENYGKGFLVGDEYLGGVSESGGAADGRTGYVAFALSHRTGQHVMHQEFDDLDSALNTIARIFLVPFSFSSHCVLNSRKCHQEMAGNRLHKRARPACERSVGSPR